MLGKSAQALTSCRDFPPLQHRGAFEDAVPFRVIRSRKGTGLPKLLWTVVETGVGQNRYDAWPRGALRIDEIEVASSRDFH